MSEPAPTRVLIVDDQGLVRDGFRMILEAQSDLEVVGEASNGVDAVSAVRSFRPDLVLMDIRMPRMDGLEASREILRAGPGAGANDTDRLPKIVILTTFDLDDYVYEALRIGASGFLLKDLRRDDLVNAVRVVAAGEALLAPAITKRLVAEFARRPRQTRPAELGSLTRREREVLELMARGQSNAEIARALVVGEQTVKTHVSNVLAKLGLRDRVHAVILAYETGLIQPGS
ncbi:transcriptional regulator [Flindersiella endophytica]